MGFPGPFDKHDLWSSLDADTKADTLLDDVGSASKRVTEIDRLLQETNASIASLGPAFDELDTKIRALSDRITKLGK